jgi:predicted porin
VFGDWKSYADFTALGNKKDLLVVGAGFDWSQNGDTDVVRHSVDAQWEAGPFGVFAGFYGRYLDGAGGSTWDWGGVAQAGYLLNSQWEVFGRYSYLDLEDTGGSEDTFHELTLGVNYYIHKHNLKVTVDGSWLPNGSPADLDAIGVLANDGNNQFILRAQLQFFL